MSSPNKPKITRDFFLKDKYIKNKDEDNANDEDDETDNMSNNSGSEEDRDTSWNYTDEENQRNDEEDTSSANSDYDISPMLGVTIGNDPNEEENENEDEKKSEEKKAKIEDTLMVDMYYFTFDCKMATEKNLMIRNPTGASMQFQNNHFNFLHGKRESLMLILRSLQVKVENKDPFYQIMKQIPDDLFKLIRLKCDYRIHFLVGNIKASVMVIIIYQLYLYSTQQLVKDCHNITKYIDHIKDMVDKVLGMLHPCISCKSYMKQVRGQIIGFKKRIEASGLETLTSFLRKIIADEDIGENLKSKIEEMFQIYMNTNKREFERKIPEYKKELDAQNQQLEGYEKLITEFLDNIGQTGMANRTKLVVEYYQKQLPIQNSLNSQTIIFIKKSAMVNTLIKMFDKIMSKIPKERRQEKLQELITTMRQYQGGDIIQQTLANMPKMSQLMYDNAMYLMLEAERLYLLHEVLLIFSIEILMKKLDENYVQEVIVDMFNRTIQKTKEKIKKRNRMLADYELMLSVSHKMSLLLVAINSIVPLSFPTRIQRMFHSAISLPDTKAGQNARSYWINETKQKRERQKSNIKPYGSDWISNKRRKRKTKKKTNRQMSRNINPEKEKRKLLKKERDQLKEYDQYFKGLIMSNKDGVEMTSIFSNYVEWEELIGKMRKYINNTARRNKIFVIDGANYVNSYIRNSQHPTVPLFFLKMITYYFSTYLVVLDSTMSFMRMTSNMANNRLWPTTIEQSILVDARDETDDAMVLTLADINKAVIISRDNYNEFDMQIDERVHMEIIFDDFPKIQLHFKYFQLNSKKASHKKVMVFYWSKVMKEYHEQQIERKKQFIRPLGNFFSPMKYRVISNSIFLTDIPLIGNTKSNSLRYQNRWIFTSGKTTPTFKYFLTASLSVKAKKIEEAQIINSRLRCVNIQLAQQIKVANRQMNDNVRKVMCGQFFANSLTVDHLQEMVLNMYKNSTRRYSETHRRAMKRLRKIRNLLAMRPTDIMIIGGNKNDRFYTMAPNNTIYELTLPLIDNQYIEQYANKAISRATSQKPQLQLSTADITQFFLSDYKALLMSKAIKLMRPANHQAALRKVYLQSSLLNSKTTIDWLDRPSKERNRDYYMRVESFDDKVSITDKINDQTITILINNMDGMRAFSHENNRYLYYISKALIYSKENEDPDGGVDPRDHKTEKEIKYMRKVKKVLNKMWEKTRFITINCSWELTAQKIFLIQKKVERTRISLEESDVSEENFYGLEVRPKDNEHLMIAWIINKIITFKYQKICWETVNFFNGNNNFDNQHFYFSYALTLGNRDHKQDYELDLQRLTQMIEREGSDFGMCSCFFASQLFNIDLNMVTDGKVVIIEGYFLPTTVIAHYLLLDEFGVSHIKDVENLNGISALYLEQYNMFDQFYYQPYTRQEANMMGLNVEEMGMITTIKRVYVQALTSFVRLFSTNRYNKIKAILDTEIPTNLTEAYMRVHNALDIEIINILEDKSFGLTSYKQIDYCFNALVDITDIRAALVILSIRLYPYWVKDLDMYNDGTKVDWWRKQDNGVLQQLLMFIINITRINQYLERNPKEYKNWPRNETELLEYIKAHSENSFIFMPELKNKDDPTFLNFIKLRYDNIIVKSVKSSLASLKMSMLGKNEMINRHPNVHVSWFKKNKRDTIQDFLIMIQLMYNVIHKKRKIRKIEPTRNNIKVIYEDDGVYTFDQEKNYVKIGERTKGSYASNDRRQNDNRSIEKREDQSMTWAMRIKQPKKITQDKNSNSRKVDTAFKINPTQTQTYKALDGTGQSTLIVIFYERDEYNVHHINLRLDTFNIEGIDDQILKTPLYQRQEQTFLNVNIQSGTFRNEARYMALLEYKLLDKSYDYLIRIYGRSQRIGVTLKHSIMIYNHHMKHIISRNAIKKPVELTESHRYTGVDQNACYDAASKLIEKFDEKRISIYAENLLGKMTANEDHHQYWGNTFTFYLKLLWSTIKSMTGIHSIKRLINGKQERVVREKSPKPRANFKYKYGKSNRNPRLGKNARKNAKKTNNKTNRQRSIKQNQNRKANNGLRNRSTTFLFTGFYQLMTLVFMYVIEPLIWHTHRYLMMKNEIKRDKNIGITVTNRWKNKNDMITWMIRNNTIRNNEPTEVMTRVIYNPTRWYRRYMYHIYPHTKQLNAQFHHIVEPVREMKKHIRKIINQRDEEFNKNRSSNKMNVKNVLPKKLYDDRKCILDSYEIVCDKRMQLNSKQNDYSGKCVTELHLQKCRNMNQIQEYVVITCEHDHSINHLIDTIGKKTINSVYRRNIVAIDETNRHKNNISDVLIYYKNSENLKTEKQIEEWAYDRIVDEMPNLMKMMIEFDGIAVILRGLTMGITTNDGNTTNTIYQPVIYMISRNTRKMYGVIRKIKNLGRGSAFFLMSGSTIVTDNQQIYVLTKGKPEGKYWYIEAEPVKNNACFREMRIETDVRRRQ